MPALRRQTRQHRTDLVELTHDQEHHLLTGSPYWPNRGFTNDLESFTAAWEFHRDRLLPAFIAKKPGHRPAAWWICEHKRERPIVNRFVDEAEMRQHTRGGPLEYASAPFDFLHTSNYLPGVGYFQEPEPDYLLRHGLLSAAEMEHLANEGAT